MTQFLQLRSANSGAPFVGANPNDTVLWNATERAWYVGPGGGGAVSSVFGRVGAVVAATGDYDGDQIDNVSTVPGVSLSDALDYLLANAGAVASVFGRVGVVVAATGDYDSDQVDNVSTVAGASVSDALDNLATSTSAACVRNASTNPGLYACAENNGNTASGYGSHAEGNLNRAGLLPLVFTIPAGGTLVTIVGDWRGQFNNGIPCRITPSTPVAKPTVSNTINSVAAFAAGNTTFQLLAPIDLTTTGGSIVESGQTITTGGVQRGIGAHAEGVHCIAQGAESHAEGAVCIAYGPGAHAEGGITTAFGIQAHSEGESTLAYGVDSHAEGGTTIAGGFCAHAEGGAGATPGPIANGNSSHAEGIGGSQTGNDLRTFTLTPGGTLITIAGNVTPEFTAGGQIFLFPQTPTVGASIQCNISAVAPVFAAGNTTFNLANPISANTGLQVPVDGAQFADQVSGGLCLQGAVSGVGAHAEGAGRARGRVSHAEGTTTIAWGQAAHSEGTNSVAWGQASHAEGTGTQAIGINAHAESDTTLASAQASHAEGSGTRAGNLLRAFTIPAGGTLVTIAGDRTTEFTNGSQVAILNTTPATSLPPVLLICASVPAFAAGNTTFNLSAAIDPYVTGGDIVTPGKGAAAHAEGQTTVASGTSSHAEGNVCTASGQNAHAEGNGTLASGTSSHAEGDSTQATNVRAHAEGTSCVASGSSSHAQGNVCTASGGTSHAEGNGTTASGTSSHAQGDSTVASGLRAHAQGLSNTASGDDSNAQGRESKATRICSSAEAGGKFAAVGDNQCTRVVVKGSTPGSAPGETTALTVGGLSTFGLDSSVAYLVTVKAMATVMGLGAAARQTAAFFIQFTASVRSGGTVDVSAVTSVSAPILQGAGFVGATLTVSSVAINTMTMAFTIAGGLTVQSRITALVEMVELLGT